MESGNATYFAKYWPRILFGCAKVGQSRAKSGKVGQSRAKSGKVGQSRAKSAKSGKVGQSRAKSGKVVQSRAKSRKIVQKWQKNDRGTLLNSCCDEKFPLFAFHPKKGKITNTHGNLAQFGRGTAKTFKISIFLFLPHDQTKFKSRTRSSCFSSRNKTERNPKPTINLQTCFVQTCFYFGVGVLRCIVIVETNVEILAGPNLSPKAGENV